MGTKLNPGKFDCHAAALPDEPLFTTLARDPLAPFLTSIWGHIRRGNLSMAQIAYNQMIETAAWQYQNDPEEAKAAEALACAREMFEWRKTHVRPEGGWPKPEPAPLIELYLPDGSRAFVLHVPEAENRRWPNSPHEYEIWVEDYADGKPGEPYCSANASDPFDALRNILDVILPGTVAYQPKSELCPFVLGDARCGVPRDHPRFRGGCNKSGHCCRSVFDNFARYGGAPIPQE